MKEIIITEQSDKVLLSDLGEYVPIFAKKDGLFIGMVTADDRGWVVRIGGRAGASGYHETRKKCLESCLEYDYTFFVEL